MIIIIVITHMMISNNNNINGARGEGARGVPS